MRDSQKGIMARRLTGSSCRVLLLPGLAVLLTLMFTGYNFNDNDQTVFLTYVYRMILGVPFSPHDAVAQNVAGVSTIHRFLPSFAAGALSPASLEWLFLGCYLLCHYVIMLSVHLIARRMLGSDRAAFLACILTPFVCGATFAFAVPVETILNSRTVALAFASAALACHAYGHVCVGAVLAGISINANPTVGFPVILTSIVLAITTRPRAKRVLSVRAAALIAMAIAALPWFFNVHSLGFSVDMWNPAPAWQEVARMRFPFVNPRNWPALAWLQLVAPCLVVWAGLQGGMPKNAAWRTMRALFWVSLGLILVQTVPTLVKPFGLLLRLQFYRAYLYIILPACIHLVHILITEPERGRFRAGVACVLLLSWLSGQPQAAIILGTLVVFIRAGLWRRAWVFPLLTLVCIVAFLFFGRDLLQREATSVPRSWLLVVWVLLVTPFLLVVWLKPRGRSVLLTGLSVTTLVCALHPVFVGLLSAHSAAARNTAVGLGDAPYRKGCISSYISYHGAIHFLPRVHETWTVQTSQKRAPRRWRPSKRQTPPSNLTPYASCIWAGKGCCPRS